MNLSNSIRVATCIALATLWPFGFRVSTADELLLVSQLDSPPAIHRSVVRATRTLVERLHILRPKLDDAVSMRAFERFLIEIDSARAYLFASDIQEFQPFKERLDDQLLDDNIEFAYLVYKRFLSRLESFVPFVHQQIDLEQDFSSEETIPADEVWGSYARDLDEAKDRWRRSVKLNMLNLRLGGKSDTEIKSILHQRYRDWFLGKSRMSSDELLEIYLSSITKVMDPHTNYRSPLTHEQSEGRQKLELIGIGASLEQVDGSTIVTSLVPGGAAEIDGRLRAGDRIVSIARDDGSDPLPIQDMKLNEVVALIRGNVGTRIKLHIQRDSIEPSTVIELVRSKIKLEDSAAKSEIVELTNENQTTLRLGYIQLLGFYVDSEGERANQPDYRSATRDLRGILDTFRQASLDAVVLDLSRNNSGALSEAISCAGLFIDHGVIVQVKSPNGNLEMLKDEETGTAWDGPLVIKISQRTISASEVFAGVIQDYGRGIVVGDPKTHGKGTVQMIVDVVPDATILAPAKPYGSLRVTAKQFYLPSGRSTQLLGVASDVVLPSISALLPISEADLQYPLSADKVNATQHRNYGLADSAIVGRIRQASAKRVANSPEFEQILINIANYKKQHQSKTTSLKESEFLASRNGFFSKIGLEESETPAVSGKVFPANAANREVLNIAMDYHNAIKDLSR